MVYAAGMPVIRTVPSVAGWVCRMILALTLPGWPEARQQTKTPAPGCRGLFRYETTSPNRAVVVGIVIIVVDGVI